jgi:iron complex transport system permease protein
MSSTHARPLTRRRQVAAIAAALLAAIAAALVCPLVGIDTGSGDRSLTWLSPAAIAGEDLEARLFWHARLPRAIAALLVGAALAIAGCAFQAVLRNPLAEPYTLGISSGSALAAVIAIRLGLDYTPLGASAVSIAAFAGAAITVYLVWRLGKVGSSLPPATLLLAGITIAGFCAAASMLVLYTSDFAEVYRIVGWMMGGLDFIRYGELWRAAVPILIAAAVIATFARDLNALSAGTDAAASVGVSAARTLTTCFVVASLAVGATIALAGPIGFVGLIVPHTMRALVGPDHRVLLPVSALAGGAFLLICDTVARLLLAPQEIPVGVVTALLGGPFFLALLLREKASGKLWG